MWDKFQDHIRKLNQRNDNSASTLNGDTGIQSATGGDRLCVPTFTMGVIHKEDIDTPLTQLDISMLVQQVVGLMDSVPSITNGSLIAVGQLPQPTCWRTSRVSLKPTYSNTVQHNRDWTTYPPAAFLGINESVHMGAALPCTSKVDYYDRSW